MKMDILKYLHDHQGNGPINISILCDFINKPLPNVKRDTIHSACKVLVEEGLLVSVVSVIIANGDLPSVKITEKGITVLNEYEARENNRRSFNIGNKTLIVTVIGVIVAIIGVAITVLINIDFDRALPSEISLVTVQITNDTSETVQINQVNNFVLWLPSMQGAPHVDGRFEFINESATIEIAPDESVILMARILNSDYFYRFYRNGDCDITFWIGTSNGPFSTQAIRFAEDSLYIGLRIDR